MAKLGNNLKAALVRSTQVKGSMFNKREVSVARPKLTNLDHLALRDQAHKSFKKISKLLEEKENTSFSKMIFTDYMYRYKLDMNKYKVIIMITDKFLYLLNPTDFTPLKTINLNKLDSILSIKTNSSIFALNFKDGENA